MHQPIDDDDETSYELRPRDVGTVLREFIHRDEFMDEQDLPYIVKVFVETFTKNDDGSYVFTDNQLLAMFEQIKKELVNEACWDLVKMGIVNMTVDEEGEFVFFVDKEEQ